MRHSASACARRFMRCRCARSPPRKPRMDKLIIQGGAPLSGEIRVSGAKNAALPLMCAALLTREQLTLSNVPHLRDVSTMLRLLAQVGVAVSLEDRLGWARRAEHVAGGPGDERLGKCIMGSGESLGGPGADLITIEGVPQLRGATHRIMPDRIETGTCLAAAAATGGRVTLHGTDAGILDAVLDKLRETGAEVQTGNGTISLAMRERPRGVNVRTAPYPGFPTDMQAQLMALDAISEGTAVITETIFENRFMHALEMQRLGADIEISGNAAIVRGVPRLQGATVMATDLRASASLVIAGLVAEGETTVDRIYHLDRGYECIEEKLAQLGARIKRVH